MFKRPAGDRIEFALMLVSLFAIGVLYGILAYPRDWFPVPQVKAGRLALDTWIAESERPWYFDLPDRLPVSLDVDPTRLAAGLVMVAGVTDGPRHFISIVDRAGTVIHQWQPDWFEIWGDRGTYADRRRPQSQPGSVIHGVAVAANGDVILNFESLSTTRLSPCGEVVWQLQNYGHHSIHLDPDGIIWAGGETAADAEATLRQNHIAPLTDYTIDKISADGRILESTPVLDILRQNDLLGLVYLSTLDNPETLVWGDTMHLNDVETYPANFQSSIFAPGDVMVSLRNINTIFVMDPATHQIKFRATGQFLRQHDPDFIGGDRILLFDNRNLAPSTEPEAPFSRILEIDAATSAVSVRFQGTGDSAFFSNILGKQQLLDNGNLLITSAKEGRAIEVAPDGTLLWEYINTLGDGHVGLLTQAEILPLFMDRQFFENLAATCAPTPDG